MKEFTAGQVKAVLMHASDDTTCRHLNGAAVGAGVMVATDGHRLMVVGAGDTEVIIATSALKAVAAVKGCKTVRIDEALDAVDENAAVIASVPRTTVDSKYPPYDQVVPKKDEKGSRTFGINLEYLRDACDALIKAGAKRVAGRRGAVYARVQVGSDSLDPIRIDAETDDYTPLCVVIMPSRL